MNRNNGIDLFRLIAAFFIMCVHTGYGRLNPEITGNIQLISRWAVPFYFITTGFFLGKKIENRTLDFNRIQKNIVRLITILIVASMVYLPVDIITDHIPNKVVYLFTGTYFHLWFIGELINGYIFIWYLHFIRKAKYLPLISAAIILLALIADSYDRILNKEFDFALLRFLLAIPFMYLGILFSKTKSIPGRRGLFIGIALAGLLIQYFEAEWFAATFFDKKEVHQFLAGTGIAAAAIFLFSAKTDLRANIFSEWGRDHSLFIYLYHPLVYFLMETVILRTIPGYFDTIQMIFPLLGFIILLSGALVIKMLFPKGYDLLNGHISF
ncbi:MAG: acyltransferase family protein [Bacteroidales bacterium]